MPFGCQHHSAVGSGYTQGRAGGRTLGQEGFNVLGEDRCTEDPPVTASLSALNNCAEKTSHHFAEVLPPGTAALGLSPAPNTH